MRSMNRSELWFPPRMAHGVWDNSRSSGLKLKSLSIFGSSFSQKVVGVGPLMNMNFKVGEKLISARWTHTSFGMHFM